MPDNSKPARRVRVPATTANLGPGFDCLGVALSLYNNIELGAQTDRWSDSFLAQAARLFFERSATPPQAFHVSITGDVPRSRGLGSSVTVRLGLLMALNEALHTPLSSEELLRLTIELEGHPDNAVPAFYGGFCACSPEGHARFVVAPELRFVAAIPAFEISTHDARAVLPQAISLADAVSNVQRVSRIVAAFASGEYSTLQDVFEDRLHQPYRCGLIPGCVKAMRAARDAGALGAFISGSGSTLMALTMEHAPEVGKAMKSAIETAGGKEAEIRILTADNRGADIE